MEHNFPHTDVDDENNIPASEIEHSTSPPHHSPGVRDGEEDPVSQDDPDVQEQDRDSVARDKARLLRFHKEAKSFLTKAYLNDDAVLVEDRFDNEASAGASNDDTLVQRRIERDKIRLERFHAQAVSFLDRAYADEPGTIIEEEKLSPDRTAALREERAMLQNFHKEAMNFLDAAAERPTPPEGGSADIRAKGGSETGESERNSWRIKRDKARLEQHYQDVMSFLNRADGEGKGTIVEEQELEPAVVDRLQLQRYAHDAMSFLDKAFRNESSVMIGDDDDDFDEHPSVDTDDEYDDRPGVVGRHPLGTQELYSAKREDISRLPLANHREISSALPQRKNSADEDRQIAADRAALQRYDEEFGDFLSRAYLDDSTVIVEDCDSDTAEPDNVNFEEEVAASHSPGSMEGTSPPKVDRGDRGPAQSASTTTNSSVPRTSLRNVSDSGARGKRVGSPRQDRNSSVKGRGSAAAPLTAHEDSDFHDSRMRGSGSAPKTSLKDDSNFATATGRDPRFDHREVNSTDDDDSYGDVVSVDDESACSEEQTESAVPQSPQAFGEIGASSGRHITKRFSGDRETRNPEASDHGPKTDPVGGSSGPLVYVSLDDRNDADNEWSEMPLEKSFYRQLPRGSTIKLRPRVSKQNATSEDQADAHSRSLLQNEILMKDLQRVERERDALIRAIEEILNERSMLAQQVSEMKATVRGVGQRKEQEGDGIPADSNIDLAAELREAHTTMAKLTEEMELTLGFLESRYNHTLERAERAEQRCKHLESHVSKLETELASERSVVIQAVSEKNELVASLREAETAHRHQSTADVMHTRSTGEFGNAETEQNLRSLRNTASSRSSIAEDAHTQTVQEAGPYRSDVVDERREIARLEAAIAHLSKEADAREQQLRGQLATFRSRVGQAEDAAVRAEHDAKEAAEVAKLAVDRSRKMLESERQARHAAEADKHSVVMESKAWEKFAQQQMEMNARPGEVGDEAKGTRTTSSDGSTSKQNHRENFRRRRDHNRVMKNEREERANSPSAPEEVKKKKSIGRLFR